MNLYDVLERLEKAAKAGHVETVEHLTEKVKEFARWNAHLNKVARNKKDN